MSILQQIIADKQTEIKEKFTDTYLQKLEKNLSKQRRVRDFSSALSNGSLSIIAEIKKASPSKGLIRPDFHPVQIAESYEKHGASCISVLTEEKYFQGNPDYLRQVRQKVRLPILRKDFIIDSRQVVESFLLGADAILLIVAALDKKRLESMVNEAKKLELHVLVEVHSIAELETALACESKIIGINNRNLKTFKTSIETSIDLVKSVPTGLIKVSESGINTAEDCALLANYGFDAVLIGETLMRKPDPGAYIPELLVRR